MRWKTTKPEPPKDGDWRRRTKFAWLPTRVEGFTVWLEAFVVEEVYTSTPYNCWWGETKRELAVFYY